jgi:cation diffusion facilitator family transporter
MSAGEAALADADAASARAKVRTASLSVVAACVLVALKLVTGLITGSLGLLAEAAHSGTDLVAALLTLFALRVAIRPADRDHQYGHGKAEHLAALGESAFLALVSLFIGYESLHRLLSSGGGEVEAHWWALAVLVLVIAIDATRVLSSLRASRRYDSAALAANALHFGSDLAGSLAVLIGLIFVQFGYHSADSIAALLVAVLVIVAAFRLAAESVSVLMDRAPAESLAAIGKALAGVSSGLQIRRVRTRHAAGHNFVDVVVAIPPDAGVGQAHATADSIEAAIHDVLPNSDVIVHVEPLDAEGDLRERATAAALSVPDVREVHNVRVMHVGDGYELTLHAKVTPDKSLDEAHRVTDAVEAAIHAAVPEFRRVYTHIEPLAGTDWTRKPDSDEVADDREAIDDVVTHYTGSSPMEVLFRDTETGRIALITIELPGEQPLRVAHRSAGLIEHDVRERRPTLADVVVHTEPARAPTPRSATP